nr:hypothetical protein GCM10010200_023250 [Actinomadura rugatobispora]
MTARNQFLAARHPAPLAGTAANPFGLRVAALSAAFPDSGTAPGGRVRPSVR